MTMIEEQSLSEEVGRGELMSACRQRKPVTLLERVYYLIFNKKPLTDGKKTARLLELLRPCRYKPETVDQLARETKGREK